MVSGIFIRKNHPALLRRLAIHHRIYFYGTITLYRLAFQKDSNSFCRWDTSPYSTSPYCHPIRIRFDLFRFRSPLLTESLLFSFPVLIMMLRFSTFPYPRGTIRYYPHYDVTFGDPRIKGYLRLPGAYRCLSRPSSVSKPRHPLYSLCVWTLIRIEP